MTLDTRTARYRKYRLSIKTMAEEPFDVAVSQHALPPIEGTITPAPAAPTRNTGTSLMTVDEIIRAHTLMLNEEANQEFATAEAEKVARRWRVIRIVFIVIIALCLIIGIAAFLTKYLK